MLLMCAGSICNTLFFKKNQREINDWCSYYFFLGGGGDYIFIVFVVFFYMAHGGLFYRAIIN